jgi:uncharacterized protein YkwD
MNRIQQPSARRSVAIAAALTALVVALLAAFAYAPPPARSAAAAGGGSTACPEADQPAEDATAADLRRSLRCLINVERTARGRARLERDKSLQSAAQKHSEAMVATGCLDHRCADEPAIETRIQRSGYLAAADAWQYAESTGCGATARAMATTWMASRHRLNLLEESYRDIGVGVVQEPVADQCDKGYATFAVVFGWRTPDA